MTERKKGTEREQDRRRADEVTERRFNETVRNLLNTPPKPHKARDVDSRSDERPRKRKRDKGSA